VSFSYQQNALSVAMQHLPYTLTLAAAAILLTMLIAIPVGVRASRRPNGVFDTASNVTTIVGLSIPEFWIGIMLVIVFAVKLGIFPTYGYTGFSSIVLPAVTVAIAQVAVVSRVVRREMVKNLASPYLTLARARGVSETALTWRYAFANAGTAVVTVLGTRFAAMLNGVVVVEVVFAWPGMGALIVRALETNDYPLIQATVLMTSTLAILVQLMIDSLYPLLDRRVKLVTR
jgi:peptide/nickel transport system permease protein